jgi:hypothetical protein
MTSVQINVDRESLLNQPNVNFSESQHMDLNCSFRPLTTFARPDTTVLLIRESQLLPDPTAFGKTFTIGNNFHIQN